MKEVELACMTKAAPVGAKEGCNRCQPFETEKAWSSESGVHGRWADVSERSNIPLDGVGERRQASPWSPARDSSRRRKQALSQSIEKIAREQEWFKGFMERIDALEQRTEEMVAKDDYDEERRSTEAALTETENKFKENKVVIEDVSKDNDRIDKNLRELDSLQEKVDAIISSPLWRNAKTPPRPSLRRHHCVQEISATDLSDEMSEVTFGSHCQSITVGLEHPSETKLILPYSPDLKVNHKSAEPTVETSATSAPSSFYDDDDEESNECGILVEEGPVVFSESVLLQDARFMRQNGRDLLVAPAPFITPPMMEGKSENEVCFPNKKRKNSQECEFCVVQ